MRILDHLLEGVKFIDSPADSGFFKAPPTLIVMHYTASGSSALNDAMYFASQKRDGASAHVVVGRDGALFQCERFDTVAHHAGRSVWRGRSSVNAFSIGIEVDNWGPLAKMGDGALRSWTGEQVPESSAIVVRHKHRQQVEAWESYNLVQLGVLEELVRTLIGTYPSLSEIVGHEDVSTGRKFDPGPAFPMQRFWNLLNRRENDAPVSRKVWAKPLLNLRAFPRTDAPILAELKTGHLVHVLHDTGDWSFVETLVSENPYRGWVFDQFLE